MYVIRKNQGESTAAQKIILFFFLLLNLVLPAESNSVINLTPETEDHFSVKKKK